MLKNLVENSVKRCLGIALCLRITLKNKIIQFFTLRLLLQFGRFRQIQVFLPQTNQKSLKTYPTPRYSRGLMFLEPTIKGASSRFLESAIIIVCYKIKLKQNSVYVKKFTFFPIRIHFHVSKENQWVVWFYYLPLVFDVIVKMINYGRFFIVKLHTTLCSQLTDWVPCFKR